uniref:Uncharacterized protein n=1 Tax=Sphaerodactylus townsendi TaxID=933632 RepID=A0ACB8G3X0_9SAUR
MKCLDEALLVCKPFKRLTHDISLEEFEDEDLSEITDECGISLHCKDSLASRWACVTLSIVTAIHFVGTEPGVEHLG